MKSNRGFGLLVAILIIIIGIIIVGGFIYLIGKNSNVPLDLQGNNNQPPANQNTTPNIPVTNPNTNPPIVNSTDPYGRYVGSGCRIASGCNGPIVCTEAGSGNIVTTCQALPEYVCYKTSSVRCEKQASGKCDWTNTSQLQSCIDTARKNTNTQPLY